MKKSFIAMMATVLVIFAGPLAAHPVHDEVATFTSGLLHPLGDWGHLLSIIGIGLWAGWRNTKLSLLDLFSWIVIGLFVTANGYVHATAVTHLTWAYAAGMLSSTMVLLSFALLISSPLKPQQSPALFKQ
ncbi:MAG: hypothetical protein AMJ53_03790 [Gammaproteobacteria bacterium SG8_11]|nr:MAG: hypothetical protein AMJ53_03790 [Gammaproteobacteria bacterium SG8_11]